MVKIEVFPFASLHAALISRDVREFYSMLWMVVSALSLLISGNAQVITNVPARATTNAAIARATELEQALRKLRPAEGFKVELFASEPLIQNPVSFAFDEK